MIVEYSGVTVDTDRFHKKLLVKTSYVPDGWTRVVCDHKFTNNSNFGSGNYKPLEKFVGAFVNSRWSYNADYFSNFLAVYFSDETDAMVFRLKNGASDWHLGDADADV